MLPIIGLAQLLEIFFQLLDMCYMDKNSTFPYIIHYCWLRFCFVGFILWILQVVLDENMFQHKDKW